MRKTKIAIAAAAVMAMTATAAFGAPTFDPETGQGFVGKGDVQYTFNWNNKALQDNAADVRFRTASVSATEVSWICTNSNNDNLQPRSRTTTTTYAGLVDTVARDERGRQVTGFNLNGYSGDPERGDEVTEGPALNSCPSGPWTLTTPAGDPDPIEGDGGTTFEVSNDDGVTWTELLEKP